MKALMYTAPKTLELVEVPKPSAGVGEVLLKVMACAICGSDAHGWIGTNGRRIPPLVMGHEFSAQVEALGDGCTSLKIGDFVAVQPLTPCHECPYCKKGMDNICPNRKVLGVFNNNGAMQEYVVMPEKHCFLLPEGTDFRVGALAEPFAVSYSAVKKAGDLYGKTVLIVGGGTIGLLALLAVKLQNPKMIVLSDISPSRLAVAEKLGAKFTINPAKEDFDKRIEEVFGGNKADVTIEAVGATPTVNQAITATAPGGTCVWIGSDHKTVDVPMQYIVTQEITIKGTYMFTHEEFGEALKNFVHLDMSVFTGNVVPLAKAAPMFEEMSSNPDKYLKCIINLSDNAE
ncbi:MAG: galactitol-1-phosphate 5-dehydrogenase [Defluviitaleaceae bacterium]|nr:galactitol-1-phosphate 5-dehydrogenase [Defluviitaleaceae bacterium]